MPHWVYTDQCLADLWIIINYMKKIKYIGTKILISRVTIMSYYSDHHNFTIHDIFYNRSANQNTQKNAPLFSRI